MSINIINDFAAGGEEKFVNYVYDGRHNFANNMNKQEYSNRKTRMKVRRNQLDQTFKKWHA